MNEQICKQISGERPVVSLLLRLRLLAVLVILLLMRARSLARSHE
jgi:hypothetical protein